MEQEVVLPTTAEAYILDLVINYPDSPDGSSSNNGLDFGTVLVSESQIKQITLENKGKYVVEFKFVPLTFLIKDLFSCIPIKGEIAPKGQTKVN